MTVKKFLLLFVVMAVMVMAAGAIPARAQEEGECIVSQRIVDGVVVESAAVGNCPPAAEAANSPEAVTDATATCGRTHTVQAGESIAGIADRNGVSLGDLLAWNGYAAYTQVEAGQTLRLDGCNTFDPAQLRFIVTGAPAHVDMNNVDYARGGFSSPWPSLSHVLAHDGKLQVGPDHDQALIDASRGAVRRTDPGNQYRLQNNDYTNIGCEEGSLLWISVQEAMLEFGSGMAVDYRVPSGANMRVHVKCPNVDGVVGSDAGDNIRVSGYRAGYGLVQHFSANPHGGFISAEGEMQALGISQSTDSCGGEGCVTTYELGIDMNTNSYTLAVWDGETMTTLETNWWTPTN